jgi:hypothetical protein
MQFRNLMRLVLLSIAFAVPAAAQIDLKNRPVTKREIKVSLGMANEIPAQVNRVNKELIAAIKKRGVNFVLSKYEEWVFQLQDASDELIKSIREAMSEEERARRLDETEREKLYYSFMLNHTRTDRASQQIALTSGREYVRRYKGKSGEAQNISLMERTLPTLERSVRRSTRRTRPVPVRRRSN